MHKPTSKNLFIKARITSMTRAMIDALAERRGNNASEVIRDAIALLFKQELERKEKHEG